MRKVAVIGGGWAGCAAAVELASTDVAVTLFESARTLGGRARAVDVNGRLLDNGQHILLGAYSESLRLIRKVGIDTDAALLRLPLQMRYPSGSGMDFVTPRLPAPLHMLAGLLRARGLTVDDKLSLARFSTTARWMDWRMNTDCSVSELLERFDQTDRLIRLMWRPLCIAALNTPPERASAQVFLNVLRDSLGARRHASDMLLPRIDLSALFPLKAAALIEAARGSVRPGTTVKRLWRDERGWRIELADANGGSEERFDAVVVATQPGHAAALLDGLTDTSALVNLGHEPITTCYLQYPERVRLDQPFFALVDDASKRHWGQFVFDRGQLESAHAGLLAVVVSASRDAIATGHEALAASVAAQLAVSLNNPALTQPLWSRVISEKRATFSCTPGLMRPPNMTDCEGLVLAGDYTAGDYPSTLEAAVRSGMLAANLVAS
ncbi:MAG TPA: hydroxysqualene dehydroxylase HpnE [Noviherbaspirillum sp.]